MLHWSSKSVQCVTTVPHPITSLPHMMGCGFEHYLLTFQWDWGLILPALPKIEISQDRRAPTASCLPTARLLGVCSSSELLSHIPLKHPEPWCTPPAWCCVKRKGGHRDQVQDFLCALCTCTRRSYFHGRSQSQIKLKVQFVKFCHLVVSLLIRTLICSPVPAPKRASELWWLA